MAYDEHLKRQAPRVLKKYLKDIGEQKTYMQNDQRVVSKDDNKNKTKTSAKWWVDGVEDYWRDFYPKQKSS